MSSSTVRVETLDELRKVEALAVSKLNENPRIARLFLMDPVRALASVGIVVGPAAIEEWGRLVGGLLPSLPKAAFELMQRSTGPVEIEVTIRGLLPPAGMPAN